MKTAALVIVLATALMSTPLAVGQTDDREDTAAAWTPVKRLNFTAEDVQGGLLGPEGERIDAIQRASHPSLIELREGFEAEVVKTMEDM